MARPIWSGSISFGLVNIPIKLLTAVRDRSVHFHLLSKDGQCRLRRKLVCPDTGEEYDFKDTARGYEIAPDQYVIIREEELEQLRPEAGRTIEITDFVNLAEIDPIYYDHSYYLVPDERGVKGYQLLLSAMRSQKKVGIAKFVMRSKQYLAALRPMGDIIALETMRYAEEVVSVEDELDLPSNVKVEKKELEVAQRLIEALETPFEPEKYKDEYSEQVRELIERKAEGEEVVTQAPADEEEPPAAINLMEALQKSLKEAKRSGGSSGGGGTAKKSRPRRKKSA